MYHNGSPRQDPTIAKSFTRLAHDVIELSELQAQLLRLDAQAMGQQVRVSAITSIASLLVFLGCIPVLLLTVAEALATYLEWSRLTSLGVASIVGIMLSGILAAVGWQWMHQSVISFQRSREELGRNISWLKSALKADGSKRDDLQTKAK